MPVESRKQKALRRVHPRAPGSFSFPSELKMMTVSVRETVPQFRGQAHTGHPSHPQRSSLYLSVTPISRDSSPLLAAVGTCTHMALTHTQREAWTHEVKKKEEERNFDIRTETDYNTKS